MEALRFEHISYLYALLLVPLFLLVGWLTLVWRRRAIRRLGDPELVSALMPESSMAKRRLKWLLAVSAFAFLVVAVANPMMGRQAAEVKRQSIDVLIALDVSNSMMAEDITPNRLERTRQFIGRLIERLEHDRVGLIIFAGKAYLQMPLTTDHNAARMMLRTIHPDMLPTQGTALAEAISLSMDAFNREQAKHTALVIFSDGEDHEEGALEAAKEAAKTGTTLFTVGVGTPRGAPVPDYADRQRRGFKTDREGNIILSRLNEDILNKIAVTANGQYFRLSGSTEQLNELMNALERLEKRELDGMQSDDFVSYFQLPLALALLLLLADAILGRQRNRFWQKWMNFGNP